MWRMACWDEAQGSQLCNAPTERGSLKRCHQVNVQTGRIGACGGLLGSNDPVLKNLSATHWTAELKACTSKAAKHLLGPCQPSLTLPSFAEFKLKSGTDRSLSLREFGARIDGRFTRSHDRWWGSIGGGGQVPGCSTLDLIGPRCVGVLHGSLFSEN